MNITHLSAYSCILTWVIYHSKTSLDSVAEPFIVAHSPLPHDSFKTDRSGQTMHSVNPDQTAPRAV